MKKLLKSLFLFTLIVWLTVGLIPPAVYFLAAPPQSTGAPAPSPTPEIRDDRSFRILNTADDTVLSVSEEEFLPAALLCELSPDAPKEALKAQIAAIATHYTRLRELNHDSEYHFTCNTETNSVYVPKEKLAERFGDEWNTVFTYISALCEEMRGQYLYYEDELITAPFFAVSAGCTQPNENVWSGAPLPYLRGVACPFDLFHSTYMQKTDFSPEAIRAAFPEIAFTEDPSAWFSGITLYPTGYVEKLTLCGRELSGVEVRAALSLRSAAFSPEYADGTFRFTTYGYGHGVGMSQAGAVYLAEQGESCENILAYFYPGAKLRAGK